MTDEKRDPSEVLARARRAWSPDEADAARVRRSIGAALAAGPAAHGGGGAAPAGPRGPASTSTSTSTWASRFLIAGAIAAASGGAGYWAGRRPVLRDAAPAAPTVSLAPPSIPSLAPRPPSPVGPIPASDTPSVTMPSLVPSRHGGRGIRHESEPHSQLASESLALEVRALRNAERALRDGNPGLALAFLQELDRQVPKGRLAEERDAADTLARCARGDHPFGVSLAAEFTERHPGSVYRARVEQACGETDSPAPGDSPPRRTER